MSGRLALVLVVAAVSAACTGTTGPAPSPAPGTGAAPTLSTLPPATALPRNDVPSPSTTAAAPPPITPDPDFVLRYATPGPVAMRTNPFAPAEAGAFPMAFAARMYRLLPPALTLVPELAADDEPPPAEFDGTGWAAEVELNRGLTWSDGDPIDAFDVQYTFEDLLRFGDPAEFGWAIDDPNGTADLVSVTALDDSRVEILFSGRPTIDRWQYGIATAAILPEHYWVFTFSTLAPGNERNAGLGFDAPSAGGYRFAATAPDGERRWEAVTNWWNSGARYTVYGNGAVQYHNSRLGVAETYGGPPSDEILAEWVEGPYAATVRWFDAGSTVAAQLAVDRGDADLAIAGYQSGIDGPERDRGVVVPELRSTLYVVVFGPAHPALSTADLRSGLSCLIDVDDIAGRVLVGSVVRSGWPSPPAASWATEAYDDPCPLPGVERFVEGIARLRDAGWTWAVDPAPGPLPLVLPAEGLQHPAELDVRLVLMAPAAGQDPVAAVTALWIQDRLGAIGFAVEIVEGNAFAADEAAWDIGVASTAQSIPPRPLLAPGAGTALTHLEAATAAEARRTWPAVARRIADEALAVPLFVTTGADLVSPELIFPYAGALDGYDAGVVATSVRR